MSFYQIFLPIATLLYFLLVFVVRSLILWKQTGVNPMVFKKTDGAHDYIGGIYRMIIPSLWLSIVFYAFLPRYYEYLLPIWYLETEALRIVGTLLLVGAFVFTSIAQYQMSTSWRIGIDYLEQTKLVTKGLFQYSRNPIFLGILASYFGTFLIMPNVLTFSILAVTFYTLQIQIRLEEEYLESALGKAYTDYKQQVRRWV